MILADNALGQEQINALSVIKTEHLVIIIIFLFKRCCLIFIEIIVIK